MAGAAGSMLHVIGDRELLTGSSSCVARDNVESAYISFFSSRLVVPMLFFTIVE